MITQYRVVEALSAYRLTVAVQDLLEQGWKLQGGIAVVMYPSTHLHNSGSFYMQAMIKEAEPTQ